MQCVSPLKELRATSLIASVCAAFGFLIFCYSSTIATCHWNLSSSALAERAFGILQITTSGALLLALALALTFAFARFEPRDPRQLEDEDEDEDDDDPPDALAPFITSSSFCLFPLKIAVRKFGVNLVHSFFQFRSNAAGQHTRARNGWSLKCSSFTYCKKQRTWSVLPRPMSSARIEPKPFS